MLSALMLVVLTQVAPCTPFESSALCGCKQGSGTACTVLVRENARRAADLLDEVVGALEALDQAVQMAGEGESEKKAQEREKLKATAQALTQALTSAEPPHCKGQEHHPISRPVAKKLKDHPTLRDLYQPRDPRFVARAKDEEAHCGYQDWHRKVDKELIDWLNEHPNATPKQFEDKLREVYSRPEMKARFPNGFTGL